MERSTLNLQRPRPNTKSSFLLGKIAQCNVERIVRVEAALGRVAMWLRGAVQLILMLGTAVVVYVGHRPVIAARLGLIEFVVRMLARCRHTLRAIRSLRTIRATVEDGRVVRLSLAR